MKARKNQKTECGATSKSRNQIQAPSSELLLKKLMTTSLVLAEDWDRLPDSVRGELQVSTDCAQMLAKLVELGLLTDYQIGRIEAGKEFGLVLGNYRVLDRIGAGAMGVVFKGEHVELRRQVAIKVLPMHADDDNRLLQRFAIEMRAVAQLQHPNIVAAIDSGRCLAPDSASPHLHYFVMEYVAGQDLEAQVQASGPIAPATACDLIHQVASALAEANRHQLIHRDIKPSNIRVTPEGQAKLLDFGLAQHLRSRMTEPGTVLGTLDFMAPEQALDSGSVDIRADIFGLGGTLYWCLTGKLPFVFQANRPADFARRLTESPPSVRTVRPDIPAHLDAVVGADDGGRFS